MLSSAGPQRAMWSYGEDDKPPSGTFWLLTWAINLLIIYSFRWNWFSLHSGCVGIRVGWLTWWSSVRKVIIQEETWSHHRRGIDWLISSVSLVITFGFWELQPNAFPSWQILGEHFTTLPNWSRHQYLFKIDMNTCGLELLIKVPHQISSIDLWQ